VKKAGFTLIEIMLVVFIIGMLAAIGIPRFFRSGRIPAQDFIGHLNLFVTEAVEKARQTGQPCRIFFNLHAKKVEMQSAQGKKLGGSFSITSSLEFQDFVINGKSQFALSAEKATVYFLINAEGVSQEVTITIIDTTRRRGEYEFYLNPFTSIFRLR
jgi:prepilin-type N-terminal cleavage/methylation domain-containing protein